MSRKPTLLEHWLVLGVASVIGISLILFGCHAYPIPSGDAHAFVPPAIMYCRGEGLVNPISALSPLVDPTGSDRYLQYPPLFPLLVATLMRDATPQSAFIVIGVLSASGVLLSSALLLRWAKWADFRPPWLRAPALMCSVVGGATWFAGAQTGRPEILVALFALGLMHLLTRPPGWPAWMGCGVLVGLAGAAQPTAGVILGTVTALALAIWLPTARASVATVISGLLAVLVFCGVIWVGPYGVIETIAGVTAHAQLVATRISHGSLWYYWVSNPSVTLLGFAFAAFAVAVVGRVLQDSRSVKSWPLFAAGCVVLVAFGWWSALRVPELAYNLQFLTPVVFPAFFLISRPRVARRPRLALFEVGVAMQALCAVGYLRFVLLFTAHLASGVELQSARDTFASALAGREGKIAVTWSMWVLSEDYRRLTLCTVDAKAQACGASTFLVQQAYSASLRPPRIPGFEIVLDEFVRRPCAVAGIKFASSVPGFGFALYDRRTNSSGPLVKVQSPN